MEKYCINREKTGTRGFWRLISGLIWYITPHIGADLPKKSTREYGQQCRLFYYALQAMRVLYHRQVTTCERSIAIV